MPLEVHPLTEADLETWARIHYAAFINTTVRVIWLREPSEESFRALADVRRKLFSDSNARLFKVIDTDLLNKVIAVAYWGVYEKERTPAEVEADLVPRPPFPEENRQARLEFMDGIFKSRREIMGTKPHVMLESIVTHPDHHRRGAGTMLLKWGLAEADRLGVVGYLEASSEGKPLYERFGYKPVRDIPFDARKYGGDKEDIHVAMLRQPQPSKHN